MKKLLKMGTNEEAVASLYGRKNNFGHIGFTLAEMMVVMLILTIVLAAFAPMMTKRKSAGLTSPWRYATNNSDAYFGLGDTQTAMIGQNAKQSDDLNSRLIIKYPYDVYPIVFKDNNSIVRAAISLRNNNFFFNVPKSNSESSITGLYNTAFGQNSLRSVSTGGNNTALGHETLRVNTTGSNNTAIGRSVLSSNTTGASNTAIGNQALFSNTTGEENVAIGQNSLYSNTADANTAIGNQALFSNTTGEENVAIGQNSLYSNTTADANIAIGYNALYKNEAGFQNIAIGKYALLNLNGEGIYGANNIAIGASALTGVTTGVSNIGIGTLACQSVTSGSYKTCIGRSSGPKTSSAATTNGEEVIYLGDSGTVVYIPGDLIVGKTFKAKETIDYSPPSDAITSDRRLKNIKGENKSGLSQVRELKVYDYTFKKDKENKPQVGVIAQDLEKIFPNAVIKGDDGYLKIRRDDMFYAMVNAIKELDTIVQNLVEDIKTAISRLDKHDEEIQQLQKENKELRERLEKLEKQFS